MSFFSDLFEGNFGNLGTDLSHTFSSLAHNPTDLAETLGVGGLLAAPFLLPELGAVFGIGGAAGAGDLATAAGLGDIGASGATDLATAAGLGDIAGAAGTGDLATAAGLGDIASAGGAADFGAGSTSLPFFGSVDSLGADTAQSLIPMDVAPGADPATGALAGTTDQPAAAAAAQPATGAGNLAAQAGINDIGTAAAAPAASATPAATAGGGITSSLSSVMSSPYTKLALAGLPLAVTLGMGQQQLPASAQALQAQALQMQQTGLTNLAQAQAGQLNAGQTAQLSMMQNDLLNQWRQTLANQGVQDPSKDARWPQIMAVIDQQVTSATAQLIQQNITNALAETGQASSALTSIAQMQMTADQNFTNALIGATKSLGGLAGLNQGITIKTGS